MSCTPDHVKRVWQCQCQDSHYIQINRWMFDEKAWKRGEEETEAWLTIEDWSRCYEDFWARLRRAWQVLRRGQNFWTEILLEPHVAREIAQELITGADYIEASERRLAEGELEDSNVPLA